MAISPWRMRLQPASYNGVAFHVETGMRAGGRRIALHEFPKRDTPYAEDMGRKAKRFTVQAYVIGPDYEDQRDALIAQFEKEGSGRLVLPTSFDDKTVVVENYSITENRQRGGYAEMSITFVEAGKDLWQQATTDTQSAVGSAADTAVGPTVQSVITNYLNPSSVLSSGASVSAIANTFMQSPDITGLT